MKVSLSRQIQLKGPLRATSPKSPVQEIFIFFVFGRQGLRNELDITAVSGIAAQRSGNFQADPFGHSNYLTTGSGDPARTLRYHATVRLSPVSISTLGR